LNSAGVIAAGFNPLGGEWSTTQSEKRGKPVHPEVVGVERGL